MVALLGYLKDELNNEALRLIQVRDIQQIGRVQGRAELLKELLDAIDASPKLLEKLEHHN